jgi:UDP-3-O-[3-hydroxymyristoyl] glucosamine N-acyltransferase
MQYSIRDIAAHVGGRIIGDAAKIIRNAAPFEAAEDDQISFADGPKFLKRLNDSAAGAFVVPPGVEASHKTLVEVTNPKAAFAKIIRLFNPLQAPFEGISDRAVIGRDFNHGQDPAVGPLVAIGNRVTIGDRVVLHPGVFLGDDVVIGDDTWLYPNVTVLERCRLGSRVIIHAGTVIGSDGYGFAPEGEAYVKIPQTGFVQIDDDVEIGAVNTIDRATYGRTWIRRGVKTDNLVHVAHNVTVGENTLLVAQAGIAGSVTVGRHVIVAGQAGISGHVTIGDNAIVGSQSGIAKSVAAGDIVSGSPEMPHRQWLKMTRVLPELPEMKRKLQAMEKRLQQLVESKKAK